MLHAHASTARRSPLRRALAALALAAAVAAFAATAGSAATVTEPGNSSFAAGQTGWTANDSCSALCTVATTFSPGSPSGTATTAYSSTLGLLGQDAGSASLTSSSFAWSGAAPSSASLVIGRDATISQPLSLGGSVSWTVTLTNDTTSASTVVESGPLGSDDGFTTIDTALSPSLFVSGDSYHVSVALAFSSSVSINGSATVAFDQIAITADQPSGATGSTGTSGGGETGGGGANGSSGSGTGSPGATGGSATEVTPPSTGAGSSAQTPQAACTLPNRTVSRVTLHTCLSGAALKILVAFPWSARRVSVASTGYAALVRSRRGRSIGSIRTGARPKASFRISVGAHGRLALRPRPRFVLRRTKNRLVIGKLGPRARYVIVTERLGAPPTKPIRVNASALRRRRR
jgi:hypothetical protein